MFEVWTATAGRLGERYGVRGKFASTYGQGIVLVFRKNIAKTLNKLLDDQRHFFFSALIPQALTPYGVPIEQHHFGSSLPGTLKSAGNLHTKYMYDGSLSPSSLAQRAASKRSLSPIPRLSYPR